MAFGHGGRRAGAGRKPKMAVVPPSAAVTASAPSTNSDAGGAEPLAADFHAPDDLSADECKVWMKLAPHALQRQTLTTATALSFEMLCRNIVLERSLAVDPDARATANHRGLIQRIDAELLRFDLSPNGKPHGSVPAKAEKPKTPLELLKERRKHLHAVG